MALTEWAHASCGLFEVEVSRRTNKDGKYIEGNTIKVDVASDIAIVCLNFFELTKKIILNELSLYFLK